jgi:alkanesulfonate monooxygenase SsuD/methylene tetrahydromethanopterin reductase-like flavin-dependent oxidoreductase (luciferase family)
LIGDIRSRAAKFGRREEDILFFPRIVPVVGSTEEDARRKLEGYFNHLSTEGTLALLSSWTGTDLKDYTTDKLYAFVERKSGGNAYIADYLRRAHPGKQWTIAELARLFAFGGVGNVIVGSPEQVADRMESFIDETGADGFNVGYISRSESLTDFIERVLPVLRQRGRAQSEYGEGTYRERLFGRGSFLPPNHPGKSTVLSARSGIPEGSS